MSQSAIYRAALKVVITNTSKPYQIGIQESDLRILKQEENWLAADRQIASRALEQAIYATLAVMGFKRFEVPTEFVASTIVVCCDKCNWMIASDMMCDVNLTETAILAGYETLREKCTPAKLFSQCLLAEAERIVTGKQLL